MRHLQTPVLVFLFGIGSLLLIGIEYGISHHPRTIIQFSFVLYLLFYFYLLTDVQYKLIFSIPIPLPCPTYVPVPTSKPRPMYSSPTVINIFFFKFQQALCFVSSQSLLLPYHQLTTNDIFVGRFYDSNFLYFLTATDRLPF